MEKAAQADYDLVLLQRESTGAQQFLEASIAATDHGRGLGLWSSHPDTSEDGAIQTANQVYTYGVDFLVFEAERPGQRWDVFLPALRRRLPTLPIALVTNFGGLDLPLSFTGQPTPWQHKNLWDPHNPLNSLRIPILEAIRDNNIYCLAECDLPVNPQGTPANQVYQAWQRGWEFHKIACTEYLYGGKKHADYPGLDEQPSYWTWSAEYVL